MLKVDKFELLFSLSKSTEYFSMSWPAITIIFNMKSELFSTLMPRETISREDDNALILKLEILRFCRKQEKLRNYANSKCATFNFLTVIEKMK